MDKDKITLEDVKRLESGEFVTVTVIVDKPDVTVVSAAVARQIAQRCASLVPRYLA